MRASRPARLDKRKLNRRGCARRAYCGIEFYSRERPIMIWVDIVGLLAVIQLFIFGLLVGHARGKYGIAAPATSGHPIFERYYRVQLNTVEVLLMFLPGLWLAAKYWRPQYAALLGAVYLVGRFIYLDAYVKDPKKRSVGFSLSMLPTLILVLAALIGAIRALAQG
jgi:glutathione S-transferase